jgi:hypothetical protein
VNANSSGRLLIGEVLPNYHFRATYQILVHAAPPVVFECLLHSNFHDLWLVRMLMTVRTGKLVKRSGKMLELHRQLEGTGFMLLAETPNDEIVMGIAGRFWRPDGGRCLDLSKDQFVDFSRLGFAKAAWNFKLRPGSDGGTVLSTETRVECFGRGALWKFGTYWSMIAPFSGFIRKAILRQIKTAAESAPIKSS